jgi:hypothetical protein
MVGLDVTERSRRVLQGNGPVDQRPEASRDDQVGDVGQRACVRHRLPDRHLEWLEARHSHRPDEQTQRSYEAPIPWGPTTGQHEPPAGADGATQVLQETIPNKVGSSRLGPRIFRPRLRRR